MKDAIGTCMYCKQTMTIKVPDSYKQVDIDNEVSKKCSCPEATEIAKRESAINLAEQEIKTFFKEHRRERNPERPPTNSHGDWPFLRPPQLKNKAFIVQIPYVKSSAVWDSNWGSETPRGVG